MILRKTPLKVYSNLKFPRKYINLSLLVLLYQRYAANCFFALAHTSCVSLVPKPSSKLTCYIIFNAPAAPVKQAEKKIAKEGTDVEVNCNVTGIPDSTVIWRNIKTGEIIEGNLLNITNISRDQAGKYRCSANNTCGMDSTVVNIDVQCKKTTITLFMFLYRCDVMVLLLLKVSLHENVSKVTFK